MPQPTNSAYFIPLFVLFGLPNSRTRGYGKAFFGSQQLFFMESPFVANIVALPHNIAHLKVPFLWQLWGWLASFGCSFCGAGKQPNGVVVGIMVIIEN